jgi:hypothetical protein
MAFEEREQFRILFLDKKNGLIADEVQGGRHRRPYAGLSPRSDPPGPGSLSYRHHPGAQTTRPATRRHRAPIFP